MVAVLHNSLLLVLLLFALTTTSAQADSYRVLEFPNDTSYGKIIMLGKGWDLFDKRNKGKLLADARGSVKAPKGEPLMFVASFAFVQHPEVLDKLPADAFECMIVESLPAEDKIVRPISRMTGLRRLDLKEGEFSDKAFAQVRSLVNLETLYVRECFVTGESVTQIGTLKKLKLLSLSILNLNWPLLAQSGPAFPNLNYLYIQKTNLTDDGLKWVLKMPHLHKLDVDDNGITDAALPYIKQLKELKEISLKRTKFSTRGLMELKALTQLQDIYFSKKQLSPADIKQLAAVLKHTQLHMPPSEVNSETINLWAPLH